MPNAAMQDTPPASQSDAAFAKRVLIVLALIGLAAALVYLSNLLLMIVGAIIVAVLLQAVAGLICRAVPIREDWAVLPAALVIVLILGLGTWLFGRQMAEQVTILIGSLPQGWQQLRGWIAGLPFGDAVVGQLEHIGGFALGFADQVPLIAMGVAGALANTGLALVGGVMLAMEPKSYRDGLLLLVPRGARGSVRRALNASGLALHGWLTAQLISMTIIGLLTGTGLWLIGIPSALGLGLFAGLAQFVPVVGPIASAVPGALVAATMGWEMLLWTLGVYLFVQQVEGNLVTPWVQKHFAGIPMALALFAIVAFGALFGPLGVILATPLTLIGLVLVRSLYIRDVLGEDVALPGEPSKPVTLPPAN
jgi:predicted PurR-regulated permease PerM